MQPARSEKETLSQNAHTLTVTATQIHLHKHKTDLFSLSLFFFLHATLHLSWGVAGLYYKKEREKKRKTKERGIVWHIASQIQTGMGTMTCRIHTTDAVYVRHSHR